MMHTYPALRIREKKVPISGQPRAAGQAQGGALLHQAGPPQRLSPGVDAPGGHRHDSVLDAPWQLRVFDHGVQAHEYPLHLPDADEQRVARLPPTFRVLVLFDDILIYSSTWVEHLQHVRLVLLRQHKLVVKQSKCSFGAPSISYLGHIFDGGVSMDPNKVEAI
jgi:hypothetical protein